MILKPWLKRKAIQKVEVSEDTLLDLLKLVARDLKDSQVAALSPDRRYATAYGAALNLANYVVRTQGYRVSAKKGHHRVTFEIAHAILGSDTKKYLDFFDICRRKRNKIDYDFANIASDSEVGELVQMTKEFQELILKRKLGSSAGS